MSFTQECSLKSVKRMLFTLSCQCESYPSDDLCFLLMAGYHDNTSLIARDLIERS
jgi:hypothetical protein